MITVHEIYEKMLAKQGIQRWWPADSVFEMMLGAILVQNTNWRNVEQAIANLATFIEPEKIRDMPLEELSQRIRPSGFYNQKALKIKAFVAWFGRYHFDVAEVKKQPFDVLRAELIGIKGIGTETADCMLAYAFDKPVVVVDAYTRRIFGRVGYEVPKKYDDFRQMLERGLPNELAVVQTFHGLVLNHCKEHCLKKPICEGCPLESDCLKIGIA